MVLQNGVVRIYDDSREIGWKLCNNTNLTEINKMQVLPYLKFKSIQKIRIEKYEISDNN